MPMGILIFVLNFLLSGLLMLGSRGNLLTLEFQLPRTCILLLQLCSSKKSETEWGPECSCRINTQGSSLALEIRNTSTTAKTWVTFGNSPGMHVNFYKVHKLNLKYILVVEFMYLVFTCMPSESYRRWFRSLLLYLCYVFWALINSLVCWFCWSNFGIMWPEAQGQGCQVLKEVNIIFILSAYSLPVPKETCQALIICKIVFMARIRKCDFSGMLLRNQWCTC